VFGSAPTVPGAPTGASATGGNAQATVSWTAPASNGGSAITNYTVTSSPGSKTCTKAAAPLSCTVTGLTNGQAYTFTVKATNGVGEPQVGLRAALFQPTTGYSLPDAARMAEAIAAAYPNDRLTALNHMLVYAVTAITLLSGFHYSFSMARRLSSS
jgi:hypothetical protein